MLVIRPFGALALGFVLATVAAAAAQNAPVAVPIVGSPAAQPRPAQPPQIPTEPPPMPVPGPAADPSPAARAQRKLELSLADGTIALEAQNVTLREILAEWQRRSGCEFVNAEKLPAGPVTLQFPAGTPELAAIDSLLHGLATSTTGYGYIVAPRSAQGPGNPGCGAVYIVPTSRPTASTMYAPPVSSPVAAPLVTPGSPDDEIPPVVPFPPGVPPAQPRPGVVPGSPNVPGQFIPNPQQPNQTPAVPGSTVPAVPTPSFGPIAPSAPGAGRVGAPPATPPNSGRGGQ